MEIKRTVFLVQSRKGSIRDLLRPRIPQKQTPWMYLGRDILTSKRLEREGISPGPRIPMADRLRDTAFALRQSYIDFIGALGASRPPLSWWMTGLSERSPFTSDVLLQLCYLSVCLEQVKEGGGDLVVFADSRALIRSIGKNLAAMEGIRVVTPGSTPGAFADAARSHLSSLVRLGYFAITSTGSVLRARLRAPAGAGPRARGDPPGKKVVLLTWADARSFPGEGMYADPYLGAMGEELARSGHDILRLVQIIPTFSYREAAARIAKLGGQVRLREEFLSLLDPLRAVILALLRFPALGQVPPWKGLDVTDIILEEHRGNGRSTAPAKACLAYLAGKRLGSRIAPRDVVYPFENHSWEKLFCLGIRESSPRTKLLGYAHATVSSPELSYSRSKVYETSMPLPDSTLVNGERYKRILVESGFDRDRIVVVGSFRNPVISSGEIPPRRESAGMILIAATVSFQESIELLSLCIEAFSGFKEIPVVIKCHPTLPFERLSPSLPSLPEGMTVSQEPIGVLLTKTSVLIYAGNSTVVMEALAYGVPYLHVSSELGLYMDILGGTGIERSASDSEELRNMILRIQKGLVGIPAGARQLLAESFEPPHPEVLEECL